MVFVIYVQMFASILFMYEMTAANSWILSDILLQTSLLLWKDIGINGDDKDGHDSDDDEYRAELLSFLILLLLLFSSRTSPILDGFFSAGELDNRRN